VDICLVCVQVATLSAQWLPRGEVWASALGDAQAVVITDPYLVSEVLGKETEIEKSIEGLYGKFNVVSVHNRGRSQQAFMAEYCCMNE